MQKRKRRLLIGAALLAVFLACGLWNGLAVRYYTVDAPGITGPIRLALLTDLHSCGYGENERELSETLDGLAPDLVLLGGDIFDDVLPDDNAAALLESLAARYPCYYVTGNHEYWSGGAAFERKMEIVERCGVKRLANEAVSVEVRGERFTLCGVDDPDAARLNAQVRFGDAIAQVRRDVPPGFTVLLSHRPEAAEDYAALGFDLALCGHAHGGQWRIPGLLNGLYAPHQGLFPKYAGGLYRLDDTTTIVSRGLAKESTRVPRFYNRPEVVVVDLT